MGSIGEDLVFGLICNELCIVRMSYTLPLCRIDNKHIDNMQTKHIDTHFVNNNWEQFEITRDCVLNLN